MVKSIISAALLVAAAAPAMGQQSQSVSFADLNLATPAGIATLDRRLARAIRRFCGSPHATALGSVARVRQCLAETRAAVSMQRNAAIAASGNGNVTAVASR